MRIAGVELFFCHPRRDAALFFSTWAEEVDPTLWPEDGVEGITCLSIRNGDSLGLVSLPNIEEMQFSSFLASLGKKIFTNGAVPDDGSSCLCCQR